MAVDTTQIVELSTGMTGPDFIDQLNANLEIAAQNSEEEQDDSPGNRSVSQSSGVLKTVYLQMQLGKLGTEDEIYSVKGSNGIYTYDRNLPAGYLRPNRERGTGVAKYFKRYCHTVLMLGIEECTLTGITVQSGETLSIFYFDSNCRYKGYVSATQGDGVDASADVLDALYEVPEPNRCFVKIMLYKNSSYSTLRQLEVTLQGEYTLTKNDTKERCKSYYFSFSVSFPSKAGLEAGATRSYSITSAGSANDITRYDNGYITLPPNYSRGGASVPLILYCHGTGGFGWRSFGCSSEIEEGGVWVEQKYAYINRFLANCGYAVCDCCGITDKYGTDQTGNGFEDNSFYLPSYISSIASLLRFLGANYNVDTDGIYVVGKSAGGFMSMLLPQLNGFNVRAAAGLSPAIMIFNRLRPMAGDTLLGTDGKDKVYTTAFFEQLNITREQDVPIEVINAGLFPVGENQSGSSKLRYNNKTSYTAYLNVPKIRRHDPYWMSANLTDEEVREKFVLHLYNYFFDPKGNKKSNMEELYQAAIRAVETHAPDITYPYITEDIGKELLYIFNNTRITIPCPIKIWENPNDTGASYDASKWFIKFCKRGGTNAYIRAIPSKGGSISTHNVVDELGNGEIVKEDYKTKYGGEMKQTLALCEMVDFFNQW